MDSDSWCSPHEVADPLADFFGGPVDVDPCSNARSIIQARKKHFLGGLIVPWTGTVYKNNPYSTNLPWIDKALREMLCGRTTELVGLVMVATSTIWWSAYGGNEPVPSLSHLLDTPGKWRPRNPRVLFTRRLKFLGDRTDGARFDTALWYFGTRQRQFDKAFAHITKWSGWGRNEKGR